MQSKTERMFVVYSIKGNELAMDWWLGCVCVSLPHSEKRVGNVYSKAKSFVDYVRQALRRLELDESKVSGQDITKRLLETNCGEIVQWKNAAPRRETLTILAPFSRWCLVTYFHSRQVRELCRCLRQCRMLPGSTLLTSWGDVFLPALCRSQPRMM